MSRYDYEKMKITELQEQLYDRRIASKDIRKPFLETLLTYLDEGRIEILPDSEVIILRERIQLLEEDIRDKSNQISRLKNSAEEFKDLAIEAEDALNIKINEQDNLIKDLRKELTNTSTVSSVCDRCDEYCEIISNLNVQIMNRKRELTNCTTETEKLKSKITTLHEELNQSNTKSTSVENKHTQVNFNSASSPAKYTKKMNSSSSPRVLVLGDSHARDSAVILKSILPSHYQVSTIFKPNATLEVVLSDVFKLTTDFTKNDYIVIIGGANNALKGNIINQDFLRNLKQPLAKTNTLLLSVPYWYGRNILNNIIYNINCNLYKTLHQYLKYVDINGIVSRTDYTRHGLHLNHRGKMNIFNYIAKIINKDPPMIVNEVQESKNAIICEEKFSKNTDKIKVVKTTNFHVRKDNLTYITPQIFQKTGVTQTIEIHDDKQLNI